MSSKKSSTPAQINNNCPKCGIRIGHGVTKDCRHSDCERFKAVKHPKSMSTVIYSKDTDDMDASIILAKQNIRDIFPSIFGREAVSITHKQIPLGFEVTAC